MRPSSNLKEVEHTFVFSMAQKSKMQIFIYQYEKIQQNSSLQRSIRQQEQLIQLKKCKKFKRMTNSGRLILIDQNQHPNYERWEIQNACLFFQLKLQQIFEIDEIIITEVLESYNNPKFNLAVVKAHNKKLESNAPVIMISTYKIHCISQLIRLQLTYGKIEGMITYHKKFDFFGFLEQINKQKQKKGNQQKNAQYSEKYQQECNTKSNI